MCPNRQAECVRLTVRRRAWLVWRVDADLPSDPHSGPGSFRQHLDIAADKRDLAEVRKALNGLKGVESIIGGRETVRVAFDARKVTASAIIDLLTPTVQEV